jgi:predicted phage terminase large subunit-like protein
MATTSDAYRQILRADLMAYVHRAFLELHPNVPFVWNWHLEVLCAKLQAVKDGKIRRLIITLPPRSLKSHVVSVAFTTYLLGHKPHARILCASYAQSLADDFALESLQLMSSAFYQDLFGTRLDREAVADLSTTAGGRRFATSVGGVTTGKGGDYLIIDDPLKADEAMSDACRSKVNTWMDTALYSRQNNKESSAIIIVAQRLHQDDLVGHVLDSEDWDVVSFSAIAPEDESFLIDTPYGPRRYGRAKGEALHPEFESLASLAGTRKRLGSAAFSAQYLQEPAPEEGLYVREHWFPRYTQATLPTKFDRILVSWDTANKITEMSDYSVGTVWGTKGENAYLLDVVRDKWEIPELERKVVEVAQRYTKPVVLVEDCASGQQLIQRLSRLGLAVQPCKPEGDKKTRFCNQLPAMERGAVHLPVEAPWLADLLNELKAFPHDDHDDQVDSVSQALRWIEQNAAEPALLTYYRDLARPKNGMPTEAAFLVPEGISFLQTQSRGPLLVGDDRIVVVGAPEIAAYRRLGWEEVWTR